VGPAVLQNGSVHRPDQIAEAAEARPFQFESLFDSWKVVQLS
jgi:hypothetical protein